MGYLKKVYEGINEFIGRYQSNPFDFLYEADIRSILFSTIFQKFGADTVSLKGGYSGKYYHQVDSIQTIPVKCEYPTTKSHVSKTSTFDIAVIDSGHLIHYDAEKAKKENWKSDPFWKQYLRIAMEIKYCQLGHNPHYKANEIDKDVEKLHRYRSGSCDRQFLGIALAFIQCESIDTKPFLNGRLLDDEYAQPSEGVYKYVINPSHWWKISAEPACRGSLTQTQEDVFLRVNVALGALIGMFGEGKRWKAFF